MCTQSSIAVRHARRFPGRGIGKIWWFLCIAIRIAVMLGASQAAAATGSDPRGAWAMEHNVAEIELFACRDALCGRIVWLASPFDRSGEPRRDRKNPEIGARGQPLCGLIVIEGMKRSGPDTWTGGWIYNPLDGRRYDGIIRVHPDGTLEVRAYLGWPAFGQSQTWTRLTNATAHISIADRTCAAPPAAVANGLKAASNAP